MSLDLLLLIQDCLAGLDFEIEQALVHTIECIEIIHLSLLQIMYIGLKTGTRLNASLFHHTG
ncbi:MAG: hypothetical protein JW726_06440 [Anaerolineales bacterium]|nr:hypothetical protein [Anaerolineales bacterium]